MPIKFLIIPLWQKSRTPSNKFPQSSTVWQGLSKLRRLRRPSAQRPAIPNFKSQFKNNGLKKDLNLSGGAKNHVTSRQKKINFSSSASKTPPKFDSEKNSNRMKFNNSREKRKSLRSAVKINNTNDSLNLSSNSMKSTFDLTKNNQNRAGNHKINDNSQTKKQKDEKNNEVPQCTKDLRALIAHIKSVQFSEVSHETEDPPPEMPNFNSILNRFGNSKIS